MISLLAGAYVQLENNWVRYATTMDHVKNLLEAMRFKPKDGESAQWHKIYRDHGDYEIITIKHCSEGDVTEEFKDSNSVISAIEAYLEEHSKQNGVSEWYGNNW